MSANKRLAPPYLVIEKVVKARQLGRAEYLEAHKAIRGWYNSLGKVEWAVHRDAEQERAMKFVDYKLTSEQMTDAAQWCEPSSPDLDEVVNQVILDGYRITFTWDKENHAIVVTVIGKTADNPNTGRGMSTRHATVQQALHLAMYKHVIVFNNGDWAEVDELTTYG